MNTQPPIALPLPKAPTEGRRHQRRERPSLNDLSIPSAKNSAALFLYPLAALFTLAPFVSPGLALALGILLALTLPHPAPGLSRRLAKTLLQSAIILLGFSMNLAAALAAGRTGLLFAAASIAATFALAHALAKLLRIAPKVSTLIASGTAICGGSAIAAVAAVIDAPEADISLAMATIFLLNAVALYLFPPLGHALHLSALQFGTWAGVAIHDVSSVVGAASRFGTPALQTATAVKLARALWIVPVSLAAAHFFRQPAPTATTPSTHDFDPASATATRRKLHLPWFIAGFLAASLARTLLPTLISPIAPSLAHAATAALALTLFLIGTALSPASLRAVGPRPLLQAVILWLFIATASLAVIKLTL